MKKTGKMKKTEKTRAFMEDSDHQSTESGALVGSNDDLLTEILLRLPVKSILRFKSVSKHWRWQLLGDRSFILRYDNLSKSHGLYDLHTYVPFDVENSSAPPPFRSLDFYSDRYGFEIVQSCNGLMLCCSYRSKNYVRNYYVFNPTTNQFAIVPLPGVRDVDKPIRFMGLAFHQTDCVHYKIICILSLDPEGKSFQIQIYSSDTGNWKISVQSFAAHKPIFHTGVYWNGAMHWAPSYDSHFYFDIFAEQLQMLPLPGAMMSSETYTTYFGESRGHLHIIVTNGDQEHNRLPVNVYEMLSDHSGWFVKYQVDLDPLTGVFPNMVDSSGYDYEVMDVVRGDKEEDTFMVLVVLGRIITYNVHDNSFKHIFNHTYYSYGRSPPFHRYIETLSSF